MDNNNTQMALAPDKILRSGSVVKILLPGQWHGLQGLVYNHSHGGYVYNVSVPDASMPSGRREITVKLEELDILEPVYQQPAPPLDLSYTLPEPIRPILGPITACYPVLWERIEKGTYASRDWPESYRFGWAFHNDAARYAIAVAAAKQRAELDELFRQDVKTAYGFTGDLDAFGNQLIDYIPNYSEDIGDYSPDQNLRSSMLHWLKDFNELVQVFRGYTVVSEG